jgi:hypothetical protein
MIVSIVGLHWETSSKKFPISQHLPLQMHMKYRIVLEQQYLSQARIS